MGMTEPVMIKRGMTEPGGTMDYGLISGHMLFLILLMFLIRVTNWNMLMRSPLVMTVRKKIMATKNGSLAANLEWILA
jgi:hypothetical protein